MSYTIDVDIQVPFIRPDFNALVDCMLEDGAVVLLHRLPESLTLATNIRRRGHSLHVEKTDERTWATTLIKKPEDGNELESLPEGSRQKIAQLRNGETITLLNRGYVLYWMGLYRRCYPDEEVNFSYAKHSNNFSLKIEPKS